MAVYLFRIKGDSGLPNNAKIPLTRRNGEYIALSSSWLKMEDTQFVAMGKKALKDLVDLVRRGKVEALKDGAPATASDILTHPLLTDFTD